MTRKARINWLNLGDQNTGYFLNSLKLSTRRNSISCLLNEDGIKVEEPEAIKGLAVNFHKRLLGRSFTSLNDFEMARISNLFSVKLSSSQQSRLQGIVTSAEIRAALFSMKDDKSPGPDGFSAYFYKKTLPIIQDDVVNAILSFFNDGKLLKEVNATIITLVPKVPNPTKGGDFRPISCCNIIYKCITKILANRLRPCLDGVVSANQTAFVPSRCIAENILLAQELVKNYHKDGYSKICYESRYYEGL